MATINDIISLSEMGIEKPIIIDKLIKDDYLSENKEEMRKAFSYYKGKNDVEYLDFRKFKIQNKEKLNPNRSNRRISHNFLKILIEQAVSYAVGNPVQYKIDDNKFMEYANKKLKFKFNKMVVQWMREARIKGRGYLHFYYDEEGVCKFAVIPAEQIIPIYADEFNGEIKEVLRYYTITGIEKGKEVKRKKVEWWTATEVRKYIQDEDVEGKFRLISINPHWNYSISTSADIVEGNSWDRVPFIELMNNDEGLSDLHDIKGNVDAYDLIKSEFINQIADVREILIKVLGYSGTEATEIMQIFKSAGVVKIDDPTGNIDTLKTEIPVEAREVALKQIKKDIYEIGQGVDNSTEKFNSSIAGVALAFLYNPLDMKCNISIRNMHEALLEFFWFIIDDYNRNNNAALDYSEMEITFNKNIISNEAEIVESLQKSKGIISDETIIAKHPYVDNAQEELGRIAEEEKRQMEDL